jgi:hypothetical protein
MTEHQEQYQPTPEEMQKAEERLTISQKRYSEARQEWFDLPKEINIAVLPERMDVGFNHETKKRILVAYFDGFSVELVADTLPGFDGDHVMDADFNYTDAKILVDNKVLSPPRATEVAKKMLRLYGAWEKMHGKAREVAHQGGPEAIAKDIFNIE